MNINRWSSGKADFTGCPPLWLTPLWVLLWSGQTPVGGSGTTWRTGWSLLPVRGKNNQTVGSETLRSFIWGSLLVIISKIFIHQLLKQLLKAFVEASNDLIAAALRVDEHQQRLHELRGEGLHLEGLPSSILELEGSRMWAGTSAVVSKILTVSIVSPLLPSCSTCCTSATSVSSFCWTSERSAERFSHSIVDEDT